MNSFQLSRSKWVFVVLLGVFHLSHFGFGESDHDSPAKPIENNDSSSLRVVDSLAIANNDYERCDSLNNTELSLEPLRPSSIEIIRKKGSEDCLAVLTDQHGGIRGNVLGSIETQKGTEHSIAPGYMLNKQLENYTYEAVKFNGKLLWLPRICSDATCENHLDHQDEKGDPEYKGKCPCDEDEINDLFSVHVNVGGRKIETITFRTEYNAKKRMLVAVELPHPHLLKYENDPSKLTTMVRSLKKAAKKVFNTTTHWSLGGFIKKAIGEQ